jgi:hypothetical protein
MQRLFRRVFTLDGSKSLDPDDPMGSKPFTVVWDCRREDFPMCAAVGPHNACATALRVLLATRRTRHDWATD